MSRVTFRRNVALVLQTMLLATFLLSGCQPQSNVYEPSPPPEVSAIRPLARDLVVTIEKTGETESVGQAEVRSRVKGILQEIHFRSGQIVEQGTLLFSIEDDHYRSLESAALAEVQAADAQVLVARSNISVRQAEVEQAQSEFLRQEQLIAQRATSQAEFESAKANISSANAVLEAARASLAASEASVQLARSNLENARLELSYTKILSPIRGRVTRSTVQLGNLLAPGDSLVRIVDSEQLYVNFTLSDREAIKLGDARRAARAASGDGSPAEKLGPTAWAKTPVLIARETDTDFPFRGQMEYVAQEGANTSTGTLRMRAIMDNQDGAILPGLLVRIRVPVTVQRNALMVPELVIQRERGASFVLVVGQGNAIRRQPIETGMQMDGWTVIERGIGPDDQIVSDGFHLVTPAGVTPKLRPFAESELPRPQDPEIMALLTNP
jgi:RND family efflux transporter MFP subunit